MNEKTIVSVHWSFWVIVTVGLLFNLIGCANYISQMNAETVAAMPDEFRVMVESRPGWGTGAFAIAVFGGALGCVLLLLRKSVAVYVFIVSLVAAFAAQVPFLGMIGFPVAAWVGWLSQLVVSAFFIWYSKQTERKGWIR